ncbi:DUF1570 domain-containing protein [Planctomycetota bacterium]
MRLCCVSFLILTGMVLGTIALQRDAFGDRVYVVGEKKPIEGEIVREDDEVVVVKRKLGEVKLSRDRVIRIERDEAPGDKNEAAPDTAESVKREPKPAKNAQDKAEAARAAYAAELQGVPWGKAHVVKTAHYVIKCNSTKQVAQRYADFMEKIYNAYDEVFKDYERHFKGKSTIYIFRNNKEFQQIGGGAPGLGGFYRSESPNVNLYPHRIVSAFHGTFGTTSDTRHVLAHEGAHQFQHLLCEGTEQEFMTRPVWWIEGLAVYFGDGYELDRKGNLIIGIPRDRLVALQRYLSSGGTVMPISEFIRLPHDRFSAMAGMAYPYAWGLCHYFLHRGEANRGRKRRTKATQKPIRIGKKGVDLRRTFETFFKLVLADPPDKGPTTGLHEYYARKFEQTLGVSADALFDDWKRYILALEAKPLGKIARKKDVFVSKELAFEIGRAKGWQWKPEDCQGLEAIRIENVDTSGLVIVTAAGNMDNLRPEDLRDRVEQSTGLRLLSTYIEGSEPIQISGLNGFVIKYTGCEQKPPRATREIRIRSGTQRFRHVVLGTLKRSYEIIFQCNADRLKKNEKDFDAILKTFRVSGDGD